MEGVRGSTATTMSSLRGKKGGLSARDSMTITGVAPWAQVQAAPKSAFDSGINGAFQQNITCYKDEEGGHKLDLDTNSDDKRSYVRSKYPKRGHISTVTAGLLAVLLQ